MTEMSLLENCWRPWLPVSSFEVLYTINLVPYSYVEEKKSVKNPLGDLYSEKGLH